MTFLKIHGVNGAIYGTVRRCSMKTSSAQPPLARTEIYDPFTHHPVTVRIHSTRLRMTP
jgi:hypothetical protein